MGQTVTAVQAPQPLGRVDGHTNFATLEFIVTNGVTVNEGDFVKLSSGRLTNASMGAAKPIGMCLATVVGDGTKTALVNVDPNMRYLIKTAGSNFVNTTIGQFYDLSTATTIDQTSAATSTKAFILLAVGNDTNPNSPVIGIQGANTAAFGIFKLVQSPFTGS